MENLIEQLHDIEGLKTISFWPLAPGYMVLIGLFFIFIYLFYRWFCFHRSWKKDALKQLNRLEKNLSAENSRTIVMELSTYLRRIALKRFSRKECAGLVGEEWLQWLASKDAKQFDWKLKGRILNDIPYAPIDAKVSIKEIKELIHAVKGWVK